MNITDKLNHEYELYFSELLKESKENIILQSYKTSIYKEILLVLTENCNENNQKTERNASDGRGCIVCSLRPG